MYFDKAVRSAWQNFKRKHKRTGMPMEKTWVENFEKFYAYIGPKPSYRCKIKRKTPAYGVVPGNIFWELPNADFVPIQKMS